MKTDAPTPAPETAELDDRVRPMLLAQAAKRDAMDWRYDDVEPVIAGLLLERDTLAADLIRLRAEVATLRASEARMREALTIAETTIADLERANASYQAALSERGIDGSKGTEE